MSQIEHPHLSGDLIARKGGANADTFAPEPVAPTAESIEQREGGTRFTGLVFVFLLVATAAGYGGYLLGLERGRVQTAEAPAGVVAATAGEPSRVERLTPSPPQLPSEPPSSTDQPQRVAATAPGPTGENGDPPPPPPPSLPTAAVPAPPPAEASRAKAPQTGPPEKPAAVISPPDARTQTWVDVTAVLDGWVEPRAARQKAAFVPPAPIHKPRKSASQAAKSYRIQLSALQSKAAAQREWRRLVRSHRGLLSGRKPLLVPVRKSGANNTIWRLQIASFADRPDANWFCRRAKKARLGCIVVPP